jgi:hypothetical protein
VIRDDSDPQLGRRSAMSPVSESLAPREIVEHSMSRITLVAPGSYDDFQARLESVLPSSTPQDVTIGSAPTILLGILPWRRKHLPSTRQSSRFSRFTFVFVKGPMAVLA